MEYTDDQILNVTQTFSNKRVESKRKPIRYTDFLYNTLHLLSEEESFRRLRGATKEMVSYPKTIRIAPSIAEIYDEYQNNFDLIFEQIKDIPDELTRSLRRKEIFRQVIKPKQVLDLECEFRDGMWCGNTARGINLRPGYVEADTQQPVAFTLGDDIVHALIGGITGSGKSVLINNIIMNLLYEYAPWEASVYIGDPKKVEFSRYGNVYQVPHIKSIAATSSANYFVSLFQFLKREMNKASQLYSDFGIQNIADFRKEFDIVIPRTIVLLDEFTQIMEDATPKEAMLFEAEVQAIAKLGRSMGYHLVFCSQTMSGTVSASVLNQFSLGIALNSDDATSSQLIGNTGAVGLAARGKGWCVVNPARIEGDEAKNVTVRAPFLNPDEKKPGEEQNLFYSLIETTVNEARAVGFKNDFSFYNEVSLKAFAELGANLDSGRVERERDVGYKRAMELKVLNTLVLGNTTRYTGKDSDIMETVDIMLKRDRNILLHSKDEDELKYITLLMTANLRKYEYTHKIYLGDVELYNQLRVGDYLPNCAVDYTEEIELDDDLFAQLQTRSTFRRYSSFCIQNPNHNIEQFAKFYLRDAKYTEDLKMLKECGYSWDWLVENCGKTDGLWRLKFAYETYNKAKGDKARLSVLDFPQIFVWMYAPNNIYNVYKRGSLSNNFAELFEEGPAHGITFIFVSNRFGPITDIAKKCTYFIVSNPEERIYTIEDFNEMTLTPGCNIRLFDKSKTATNNFNFKKFQVTRKILNNPFE